MFIIPKQIAELVTEPCPMMAKVTKAQTKLAALSEATVLILLGFPGKLYRIIMVLLFADMMQTFLLLTNSYLMYCIVFF